MAQNGYEIYIITNQAGIARGIVSEKNLRDIHEKLQRELSNHGIKISGIYYCPHGWKDNCECRKPKAGLLFQAAREHYLDLTESIFIGDDERDLASGEVAGCKTVLVSKEKNFLQVVKALI